MKKHLPAARTSPFYVGRGYQPKIDWTEGKKSAVTRLDDALVELRAIRELLTGDSDNGNALSAEQP